MSSSRACSVVRAGEGAKGWILGDHYSSILGAEHTEGKFTLGRTKCWPGGGPPPHVHEREDEMFYVLEGSFQFMLGEELTPVVGAGFAVYLPRGVVHQFRCVGEGAGRLLVITSPCGFESFVKEVCEPTEEVDPAEMRPMTKEAIGRVMGLVGKYGIEIRPEAKEKREMKVAAWGSKRAMGGEVGFRLGARETKGNFCVIEATNPPGGGPPAHLHKREDEVFHVVEGEYEFRLGQRVERCGAGATVHVPRGLMHAYRNVGQGRGKMLLVHTPGGIEGFFEEAGELEEPLDPARVKELFGKYGMELAS